MTPRPRQPEGALPPTTLGNQRASRAEWHSLWVLAGALGMIVLDGTIVGVALPTIIRSLHLELVDAQWVNSLYSVVFAALLVTVGRLGDQWGRKRLLLLGIAVFCVGSICAALATTGGILLAARAAQGVGGAMVLPSTLSTVNATFRGKDRAAAFGIWGAVMSGAAALGPLLGGWLTQVWGWRSVFWVNVPVGILLSLATVWCVRETREPAVTRGTSPEEGHPAGPGRFDGLGTVLSACGFGLGVFGIIEGTTLGWWTPKAEWRLFGWAWPSTAPVSPVPVALCLAVLALTLFVLWEWRRGVHHRMTLLDLRVFRIRSFSLGIGTAGLVAVGEFSLLFVLPLYLVDALHLGTLESGGVLAAMAAGAFVSGALARKLSARIGATLVVVVGLFLETVGAAGTAVLLTAQAGAWAVAAVLLPYGVGLGLAAAQLTSVSLADIPAAQSGVGSGTQSTIRQLGSAVGSAVGGAVFSAWLPAASLAASTVQIARAAGASLWWTAAILLGASGLALWLSRGNLRR